MTTITIDTREFDRALRLYYEVSKSTMAEIINRKAFFIALRTMAKTPVMSRSQFSRSMATTVWAQRATGPGGMVKRIYALAQKAVAGGAYGGRMKLEAREFARSRIRSRGYLKGGWLPALAVLSKTYQKGADYFKQLGALKRAKIDSYVDRARVESGRVNPAHGYGRAAKPGPSIVAEIANHIAGRLKGVMAAGVRAKAQAALQDAFNAETASMIKEAERRLIDDSIRIGRRRV